MNFLFGVIFVTLLLGVGVSFFFFSRYYKHLIKKETIRARKSEQLKSVFLANVSHSLRAPMNAILGFSNLLLEERDETMQPQQVKETASQIKKNSQKMLDYLSQLLELSNFQGNLPSFTLIEVNLAELMASYRREAMNLTAADVTVSIRSSLSPHCKATLDTNYMHQLMMYLLADAARHTSQGDIAIFYGAERKGLKVSITYTGVGQSDLIGSDIYSFLQKEDILAMGKNISDLGFPICKAIIDVLEGEIDLDTQNGRKTIATFWFPCKLRDKHERN